MYGLVCDMLDAYFGVLLTLTLNKLLMMCFIWAFWFSNIRRQTTHGSSDRV